MPFNSCEKGRAKLSFSTLCFPYRDSLHARGITDGYTVHLITRPAPVVQCYTVFIRSVVASIRVNFRSHTHFDWYECILGRGGGWWRGGWLRWPPTSKNPRSSRASSGSQPVPQPHPISNAPHTIQEDSSFPFISSLLMFIVLLKSWCNLSRAPPTCYFWFYSDCQM